MMAENSHLISKMPERETGLPNTYETLILNPCAIWTYNGRRLIRTVDLTLIRGAL